MTGVLILGGTGWLGRQLAGQALAAGHQVSCLARGSSGEPPVGIEWIRADRTAADPYRPVIDRPWDLVVEISWQPGMVESALAALAAATANWVLVSSCSVYAGHDKPGADESAAVLPAFQGAVAGLDDYGEAKARCEDSTSAATDGGALLARVGLIGGPGDPSDRTGYWPGRVAAAAGGPMLVPDDPDVPVQIIDVRDLAAFLLAAGLAGRGGPVNVVGEQTSLASAIELAISIGARSGFEPLDQVTASPEWLAANQVSPWSGPTSLPLWIPGSENAGFGARSDARAVQWGLRRRPLPDTFTDLLADEIARGLTRPRRAGLDRQRERELIELRRRSA